MPRHFFVSGCRSASNRFARCVRRLFGVCLFPWLGRNTLPASEAMLAAGSIERGGKRLSCAIRILEAGWGQAGRD